MKQKAVSSLKALLVYSAAMMLVFGFAAPGAYATNGMNLEGYGPIATGMGGASMAYDNGTAAMMNNPATLSLMPEGNRLDAALGYLGPHVTSKCTMGPCAGASADSSANAFFMPAIGWAHKSGPLSYGAGVFAQGGMGTEYAADSFLAAGSNEKVRSEVSVGRAIVPVAYEVNKDFGIAASIDFVWAGMDLKMALPGASFLDMTAMGTQTFGTASGSMVDALAAGFGTMFSNVKWARFDFSNSNPFTGEAMGYGVAGKVGAVYKVGSNFTVGATYHSQTALGDLETDNATLSMNVDLIPSGNATIPVTGKIKVKDFQWPQTVGIGTAYQATDKLMLVLDYKWINWADAMKNFKVTFTADDTQDNVMAAGFGGKEVDVTMFQKWRNQNVVMLGAGYKFTDEFTLRGGVNVANNPVPAKYMNPLFPAIITNHVMVGAGYMLTKASSVDASFTYAPEVQQTNGQGITVTHSQTNAQVMYSYRF